ncbi:MULTISPECIES: CpXC domain-containing protein [Anaerococcus]|uniref:CpXC domain-containing protein n=1 Tax=Anaerococcus nagyae TaxID=1755241 RepID=A0A3E2TL69_9FIRM|nr:MULTISPECIES: CpXC domain-containing protein [Anaerococcus]MDU1828742.1 CpXC domain-containing protein [Anaerococcus sp.]MDU1865164.1 CpXC domain-containing protein [Anaerococcus sp.]MDU2353999.1 CpXC domain-containing protein [Anaerococcus sp.]MDU2565147.1 CpXC domain-containing protein [Anaerococcus sp.]MDU3210874.1 CpXC domain-containing protein [Anaerococcus sp.]
MQTREKIFGVTCPVCKHSFETELNTAIFSATEDREKILNKEFGELLCPSCGHRFILNYRFAYTDDEIKFMIVNDPKFVDSKARMIFKSSLSLLDRDHKDEQNKYLTRMTSDLDEVCEKIVIFENYLSDKAVEIMKYILLESEELSLGHDDVESFRLERDDKFHIITTDGNEYTLGFVREVYDNLLNRYSQLLEIDKAEKVDKDWAYNFLKDIK